MATHFLKCSELVLSRRQLTNLTKIPQLHSAKKLKEQVRYSINSPSKLYKSNDYVAQFTEIESDMLVTEDISREVTWESKYQDKSECIILILHEEMVEVLRFAEKGIGIWEYDEETHIL